MKKNSPIRMCITCRQRESQKTLMRLQLVNSSIIPYRGFGRSIYLCNACGSDEKKMNGMAKRFRLERSELSTILKELRRNG